MSINIKCKVCNNESSYYSLNCSNCNNLLRDRVVNIDLWNTISLLIETPSKAFEKVTFSENKNFIYGIIFFLGIKIWILSSWIGLLFRNEVNPINSFYEKIFISFIAAFLSVFLTSLIPFFLLKFKITNFRFNDIYATTIYSFIPIIFSTIILFPLEVIIFGEYLFSVNPSPFEIKPLFAYLFVSLEIGLIIWSYFLLFISFKYHSNKKLFSIIISKLILVSIFIFSFIITLIYYY